jgi:hypothetical protein
VLLSTLLTDIEVMVHITKGRQQQGSCNGLEELLTDMETKNSVLTQKMETPSPNSLCNLPSSSKDWWHSRHWRADFNQSEDNIDSEISLPSNLSGDAGSSCGSDACKLPSVFTPTIGCGSSCGTHLTSISQVLQRSNSLLGALN